jgi:hypothetical protein
MESAAPAQRAVPRVDTHLIHFGQGGVVLLTGLAFALQAPVLVAVAAATLLIAAAVPAFGPFRLLYRGMVVPLGLLRPRVVEDDPAPHRFAQGVGATFLAASSLVLYLTNAVAVGWALDLIVFVLAGINLTVGFCAGCFVYYQLGRLGVLPRVRYAGSFRWRGA